MNEEILSSKNDFIQAMQNCSKEPIHILDLIQPHGFLICVDIKGFIVRISDNVEDFIGLKPSDCIGKPIYEIIKIDNLDETIGKKSINYLKPVNSTICEINDFKYDVVTHNSMGETIIEFEPRIIGETSAVKYFNQLYNFSIGLKKIISENELYNFIVDSIRNITYFDRVELYKFDEDYNGKVVAEAKSDFIDSFLGFYFPASDIPPQARKLYLKNLLRIIPDVDYMPSKIIDNSNSSLDLTMSILRSALPSHIQHLKNIGVKAFMSVSLVVNGKLWGLITCHHKEAHYLPYSARNACEIMGKMFATEIAIIEDNLKSELESKRAEIIKILSNHNNDIYDLQTTIYNNQILILDALSADNFIARINGENIIFGNSVDKIKISKLFKWLERFDSTKNIIIDNLDRFEDGGEAYSGAVLCLPLKNHTGDYIIWLRNSNFSLLKWAGCPEKYFEEQDGIFNVAACQSFDSWEQYVRQKPASWSDNDVKTAIEMVELLSNKCKKINDKKVKTQKAFLENINREMMSNLSAIIGIARVLNLSNMSEQNSELIKALEDSSSSLMKITKEVLEVSVHDNFLSTEIIEFDIKKLLKEIYSIMHIRANEKGLYFIVTNNINYETLVGEYSKIEQLIMNFCSNLIKLTNSGMINIIVEVKEGKDKLLIVKIRDTGVELPQEYIDNIFNNSNLTDETNKLDVGIIICKHLIEALEGSLFIDKIPNECTLFTISIPLTDAF